MLSQNNLGAEGVGTALSQNQLHFLPNDGTMASAYVTRALHTKVNVEYYGNLEYNFQNILHMFIDPHSSFYGLNNDIMRLKIVDV